MRLLLIIIPFILSSTLLAEISVTISAEKTTFYEDETIEIQVEVGGTRGAPAPKISGSAELSLTSHGASSQVQIINGRMNASTVHSYSLQPQKPGTYSVGPAVVEIDGKSYQSTSITLQVLKASEKAPEETFFYLETSLDQENPVVGQQIIYTLKFFNRAQIADANLALPEFDGFWKEELDKQRTYEQRVDGISWQVTEIKLALFPTTTGKMEIPAASLSLSVLVDSPGRGRRSFFDDPFFGGGRQTKSIRLHSKPLTVMVSSLPKTNKPTEFSGLVGDFTLETSLSKNRVEVGESLTLTAKVEGFGNIRDAKISFSFDGVKTYEDKPILKLKNLPDKSGGYKEFKIAIVPQKEGLLELTPITLSFFDPRSKHLPHHHFRTFDDSSRKGL